MSTAPYHKTRAVVSRHWHKPEITVALKHGGPKDLTGGTIEIEMPMEEFLRAVVHEMGNSRWALSVAEFESRLIAAHQRVVEKMKAHSHEALHL